MATTVLTPQTLARLLPYYTPTAGINTFINTLIDAYQQTGHTPPPWSWSLDDFALQPDNPVTDQRYDANGDGHINSLDHSIALMAGVPAHAPAGYTVEDLIADATGTNDGTCCPPVNTYDWGQHAKNGCSGQGPTGDQLTGWGTAQWLSCGASVANARVQVQNLKVLAFKSDHTWQALQNGLDWVITRNPDTSTGDAAAQGTTGDWVMPQGQRSLHWATNRQSVPSGTLGLVVTYEGRGDGIMMNAGADNISGGNIQGDMFISKYKAMDAVNWTHVGGSSVTQANLLAYPPPL